jgi:hypothetical protein
MLATIYFVRGQKYALFEVPTYPESMEETRGKEEEEEVEKSSARVVWGEVGGVGGCLLCLRFVSFLVSRIVFAAPWLSASSRDPETDF